MRFVPIICIMFVVVLTTIPAQALESLVLYDGFNPPAQFINPYKWFGTDFVGTEAIRAIEGAQLRMFYRAYGDTVSNIDATFNRLALNFINPAAVTAIQATVTVSDFEITGCPLNPEPSRTRVRLQGFFFNTAFPMPGDSTNDVVAQIRLQRRSDSTDPPGIFRVQGFVFKCTDAACNGSVDLAFVLLGFATVNQPATLLLQWDQPNHKFIFGFNGTTVDAPYFVSDTAPPSFQSKAMHAQVVVANCTAVPRPVGSMDALFNNVFVNASAAVTTPTPPIPHRLVIPVER